jgi:O-antigen ligase/tetratricopeptide (TPR) repeat protein
MTRPAAIWTAFLAVWAATQAVYGAVTPSAVAATAMALAVLNIIAFVLLPGGLALSRVMIGFLGAVGTIFVLQFLPLNFLFPVTAATRASHGISGAYPGTADAFLTLRCLAQCSIYVLTAVLVLKLRSEGLPASTMLQGLCGILLIQAAYALIQQFAGLQEIPFYGPRISTEAASGSFVNRNTFAGVMAMGAVSAAGLAYAHFVGVRRFDAGLGWALAASLFLVALVLSRSRGGAVGVAVGLLLVPLLHRGRSSLLGALLVLAAGGMGVILADPSILIDRFKQNEVDAIGRWRIWTSTITGAVHQPILGFGVGTHPHAYHPYQPVNLTGQVHHAHNEYVNLFFEGGLAWLLILAGGFIVWAARTWKAGRHIPTPERVLSAAVIAAACAEAAHSLVDFDLRVTSAGMLFAALIGLGGAIHRPKAEPSRVIPALCAAVGALAALLLIVLPLDPEARVEEAARSEASRAKTLALEVLKVSPYNYRAAWIRARASDEPDRYVVAAELWPAHAELQKDVGLRLWARYAENGDRAMFDHAARCLRRLFEQRPSEVGEVVKELWWKDATPSVFEPLLPEAPAAWGEFAGLLVAKGQWRQGLEAFRRGCPEVSANASVFDAFARRLTAEGQWGMAAAILERRLKLISDPAAHGAAARAWGRIEAYDRALLEAELARRTDPLNPEWVALTGDLLREDHQLGKALEWYMKAVRLAPLDLDLRLRRASLYAEMKLWSSAGDDFREVLRARPADRGASLGLAQVLIAMNDRLEARRVLEDMLRRYPGDGTATQILNSLR